MSVVGWVLLALLVADLFGLVLLLWRAADADARQKGW